MKKIILHAIRQVFSITEMMGELMRGESHELRIERFRRHIL